MEKYTDQMMTAVTFDEPGKYAVVKKPVPKIKHPTDLLVKIDACSICGSDMQILRDPPGIQATPGVTIGHEMVGTIVETGEDVRNFKVGDRITADNNVPCGRCYFCRTGHANMCENMYTLGVDGDGFFAQYAVIPDRQAIPINAEIPSDIAIFTEPLNCVMSAVEKLRVLAGETAVVIGAGPIGLYFIQLLKKNGAGRVIAVELSEYRRTYAKKVGADLCISSEEYEKIFEQTGGMGADIVVDAVGCCLKDAVTLARAGGRIMLFGVNLSAEQTFCQSYITRKDLTVIGSYIGIYTWHKTVQLLAADSMKLEEMITHRLPLEEFGTGYEAMKNGTALEVILYPNA